MSAEAALAIVLISALLGPVILWAVEKWLEDEDEDEVVGMVTRIPDEYRERLNRFNEGSHV